MAEGELQEPPPAPEEPRYHLGRGNETFGPYLRAELIQLHQDGQIVDTDFVWDDPGQAWVPLPAFLASPPAPEAGAVDPSPPQEIQETVGYPCHAHADQPASGHCADCGKLLCLSCIQIKSGDLYCQECAASVKEELAENPLQDRIQQALGIFYDNPIYAITIILILALILMPSSRSKRVEATVGIDDAEANRLWKQAHRTMAVAQLLGSQGQTDRARNWYDLSLAAAGKVADDRSVSSLIREQVIMFQMRIALDLEKYDLLDRLIGDIGTKIERPVRHSDLTFFKACNEYLNKKNTKQALILFNEITHADDGPYLGGMEGGDIDLAIEVMTNPASRASQMLGSGLPTGAAAQLMGESYTEAEVYYRHGECYERDKNSDKAEKLFYHVYHINDPTGVADRWRKLAMKRMNERPSLSGEPDE